jgi:hypothetical protein
MRKLKLDVAALQVDSFEASSAAARVGTVQGRSEVLNPDTGDTYDNCNGGGWGSLFGTCAPSYTCGTCVGPTYCCPPTWRPTCNTCYESCADPDCFP